MDTIDVVVARIGKPHGLRGAVTVEVRTDEPERRLRPGVRLQAAAPPRSDFSSATLTVASTQWHQGRLLLTFDEITDRSAAEAARNVLLSLSVPTDERPDHPEEFYDHQLVGLAVDDVDGTRLGEVSGLLHGAQDVLTIRTTDGREAMVPFVAALVPAVDLEAGRIVVADRPGLIAPFEDEQ